MRLFTKIALSALLLAASFFPVETFAQTAAINQVHVYKQTTGNPPSFIVEITVTNLLSPEAPRVVVFPSTGTTVTILQAAADFHSARCARLPRA